MVVLGDISKLDKTRDENNGPQNNKEGESVAGYNWRQHCKQQQ